MTPTAIKGMLNTSPALGLSYIRTPAIRLQVVYHPMQVSKHQGAPIVYTVHKLVIAVGLDKHIHEYGVGLGTLLRCTT